MIGVGDIYKVLQYGLNSGKILPVTPLDKPCV